MPNSLAPIVRSLSDRTSLSLARTSLFRFMALLAVVFAVAAYSLIFLAQELDRSEQVESAFYTRRAVQSLEKSLRVTVKDYAFWSDAYRHLHVKVDDDWAFVRGNIGASLFDDFGFQGLFVVDDANRTVYAVVDGQLQTVELTQWLGGPITGIIEQARAGADSETSATTFINVRGSPALVAAAAITPGTDPTVLPDGRPASVLIFVDILDSAKLTAIGDEFGVDKLHIATPDEIGKTLLLPLGDNGAAGSLHWEPARPGLRLMGVGLPLLGLAALLVCLMSWVISRRTTAAALALDASHSSLQNSQNALATSEARFRDVVEASSDWVWEIDGDWRFTYLSERFEGVTGLVRDAWIGATINDLLETETGLLSQWLSAPGRRPDISVQCRYVDALGLERSTRLSARQMPCGGFRGTATDVTEEVEARRRIEFLSQHDALTGLPNRTRLQAFLEGKFKAMPTSEQPLVMLSLDLDRFKPVNDLLGHAAGDRVLNEVSSRLADCVRHGDLVARIGGDEFVLILTDAGTQDEVEILCKRLIESIERTIRIDEQEVFVSASIGIAIAPNDAREAAELLRYADIALYEAKAAGRNTWRFYSGDMNARIIERRRLESDLRYGIKHGELRLYFQPRYRIADGQMVGAEALVRWQHPVRGLIAPDTFIPIAEESGLILALSDWVLETACACAAQWPEHLFVSVNLSPTEFKRGNLVERTRQALAVSGIDPARVELEITESVMLEDASGALEVMHTLKRLGLRIAMDDFGTGYSSLSYLRAFPFDGLKIDRSFLTRLEESDDDKAIIHAIVGLGRALALTVTAEGIETAEHLAMLKSVACEEGQGYFLSRPLDFDGFNGLLGPHANVTQGAT
ncbi:bifunctional diguanylate cyclase/phosphodiesterase [Pseudomonas simiae]|uniref:EAL domain-containing protein n=1 Tax=Pseudomonas simiae TaxID=321846 RepID=A0ABS9G695_9PSED|nr:EAL domain-containing protein [Pseudomonas simiae]MCF5047252.1 EAL domain-containing protein [Pseudomonas simiae]MCF5187080.1 EAL domain-containing protein [Pseudomonas simiae]MCF5289019.1 EAL domain-containing protein [Pseudomonas simiae]MCF5319099.1 EAL domain-containing protein [Pseudomonas simiae]MCF5334121.1 EAL domain-containing protein [Pseudomonas simiae]